jgi:hypothetical protein
VIPKKGREKERKGERDERERKGVSHSVEIP